MKSRRLALFLLLFFIALLPVVAQAAQLKGVVTDPAGAVVPGAAIELLKNGRAVAHTQTDAAGRFELNVGEQDRSQAYELRAQAKGFRSATLRVELAQDKAIAIKLRIAAANEEVAVYASGDSQDSQLAMGEVRDSGARDLGEALSALDGISKIRKAGIANDLVVRGFQQGNINVMVDGSRTFGACPGHMDPPAQHVDFAEVERVDVLKGPYDVANQGSLGASVNVVTKLPGMGFQVKPSLSVGSFNYFNPSVTSSYGTRDYKMLMGYSFRNSDPYRDGDGNKITHYNNYAATAQNRKAFDINSGWFNTEVAPGQNQKLSLAYTRQVSGMILYPYLTMDADYDRSDRAVLKYKVDKFSSVAPTLRFEGYYTNVQHYMSDRLRTSALPTGWKMASDATTRAIGGRAEADIRRYLTVGVESYSRNWNMFGFGNMNGAITRSNSIPNVDTMAAGTFLDYRQKLTQRVRLNGGVRFDHATMSINSANFDPTIFYLYHNTRSTRSTDNYPSGNLRLTVNVFKHAELFLGAGTTGRIPDAEERYINRKTLMGANMGNPLLPITRNSQVDVGLTLTHGRSYFRPSLFYSNLSDYIIVNDQPRLNMPSPGVMWPALARSYQNIGARIYGGEISWAAAINSALSLAGGGSYSRGIGDRIPAARLFSSNLPEMPPLHAWAVLRYVKNVVFAEVGGEAAARQDLVNLDLKETPTPGYGTMNLRLGFSHKGWNGSLVVENLLNRFYYEHLSYYRDPDFSGVRIPEPGRTIFVQLKYNFVAKQRSAQ